jgi:hypothetical protein
LDSSYEEDYRDQPGAPYSPQRLTAKQRARPFEGECERKKFQESIDRLISGGRSVRLGFGLGLSADVQSCRFRISPQPLEINTDFRGVLVPEVAILLEALAHNALQLFRYARGRTQQRRWLFFQNGRDDFRPASICEGLSTA